MSATQYPTGMPFDQGYYEDRKRVGLDFAFYGTWQQEYGRWIVDNLNLRGRPCLDAGCAAGSIMRGLLEAGADVIGIDICEPMIAMARAQPGLHGRVHTCDTANMHLFKGGIFEFVHVSQCAEHWRPELVQHNLRELARVARPGALLFLSVPHSETPEQVEAARKGDPSHVSLYSLGIWGGMANAAGWATAGMEDVRTALRGPDSYWCRNDGGWAVLLARRANS